MALFKHKMDMEVKEKLQQEITSRRRVEALVEAFLKEKELLLEEIHEGVRTSTQLMFGLLDMHSGDVEDRTHGLVDTHFSYVKDRPQQDVFRECQNRIVSMALVQERVYRSGKLAEVDLQDYIEELTRNLYRSYRVGTDEISLEIDLAGVSVGVDTAIVCGLIVNELVSNSLRHAFPEEGSSEERTGKMRIALVPVADDEFELTVSDDGIGLPADIGLEDVGTLGLKMLVAFAEGELQGSIELDRAQGTEFRIRFKPRGIRRDVRRLS
jgi:two-component sensor histidine kinase